MTANQYQSKSGTPRQKVREGQYKIGDIIATNRIGGRDMRVISLGKVWEESYYVDAEDARSFGRTTGFRGRGRVQYAYLEPTGPVITEELWQLHKAFAGVFTK